MFRKRRVQELSSAVSRTLQHLELPADTPAHDAWLAPLALASALEGDTTDGVLLRVGDPLAAADEDGFAAAPPQPLFMLVRSGATVRVCPLEGAPRSFTARRLRLVTVDEPCCDSPKCEATRAVRELRLEGDGDALTLGEALEPVGLTRVAHALARRLEVPCDAPALDADGDAAPAPPLSASSLARWMLRREGELFVLRDLASRGPREAALKEWVGMAAMALGAGIAWVAAYDAYRTERFQTLAIAGAIGLVLTLAAYATFHIAMHSTRYRAKSEALLYAARDRFVVAPWHSRSGAVDHKPEGRYGAALRVRELERIDVIPDGDGFTLRAHSSHGPIDIGTLETEEQATTWRNAVVRLLERVSHHAAPALALVLLCACGPAPAPHAQPSVAPTTLPPTSATMPAPLTDPTPAPVLEPPAPAAPTLTMIEDDIAAAEAEAKKSQRALFVEVWAPWCHTCLSMKNFVLPDPSIAALEPRVVFAAVDSDRPENEAFVDRYAVTVWPTLYVLDPADGKVLGLWQGAASVKELHGFITSALDDRDAQGSPNGPVAALRSARQAHAAGRWKEAARAYQQALDRGGSAWPRKSEALSGLLFSEYRRGNWQRCVELGIAHVGSIQGAALPADFSAVMLGCAAKVTDPALRKTAREHAVARLEKHVLSPPVEASVDDKSDALAMYANILQERGDKQGARAAREKQLALLEAAAKAAPGPKEAATFDYARMGAYLSLGRGEEAVTLLAARVKELPDTYEPPARLAQALMAMGRPAEAKAPMADAVAKSYGPRKLRYLSMQADLLRKLKDGAGEKQSLEALVATYEGLSAAQRKHPPTRELADDAKKRLSAP